MACNPAEVSNYLKGARFPATGGELASVAASNKAIAELICRTNHN